LSIDQQRRTQDGADIFPSSELSKDTLFNNFHFKESISVARIAGVDLPRDKRIEIGLTYIYGIGLTRAKAVIAKTGVNPDTRVKDLSDTDVATLRETVEKDYQIEGDLRRWEQLNIKRLVEIGTYRGRRHRMGLPVRGQRTRTNARTRRGRRATVAGKKKAPGKK
jgi:small subunit ribosomal protein S13